MRQGRGRLDPCAAPSATLVFLPSTAHAGLHVRRRLRLLWCVPVRRRLWWTRRTQRAPALTLSSARAPPGCVKHRPQQEARKATAAAMGVPISEVPKEAVAETMRQSKVRRALHIRPKDSADNHDCESPVHVADALLPYPLSTALQACSSCSSSDASCTHAKASGSGAAQQK
jgi:hypothetical protein